jgi:signal transduction histidine kinase
MWMDSTAAPIAAARSDLRLHAASSAASPVEITRQRPHPARFGTRRRLFAALSALAAAFALAFALQLHGLDGMKHAIAELHEHQDEMRSLLELESSVRDQFVHRSRLLEGDAEELDFYEVARARTAELIRELSPRLDEPGAAALIADIADAVGELDRGVRDGVARTTRAGPGARAHDGTYAIVFRVEEDVDRLFALMRDHTVEQSRAVDGMRVATLRLAILFLAGVPLLAVALALYLSRSIARPLAILGEGAARMAEGDLASRVRLSGSDEFGTLASELNDMAAALKGHQEQLVRAEKLASLGRMAAGIAHEIDNPLQVMLGYLTLHRGRVPGELGKHLAHVEREAKRCTEIVEGLLQLSRPVAPFVPVPVELRAVCEEVADAIRTAMNGTAPAIRVEGEATALGTSDRLAQILFNLAKNAAEAAGAGGEVELRAEREGGRAQVVVRDTGPGIPPELREHVFEPFFTTKSKGTGLGLAIARAVAGSLGGDVELDPGAPGSGARFVLRVRAWNGGG